MIDGHVHVGGGKYLPAEEWFATADRLGVDGALLVQHLGHTDNAELLAAAATNPARYAVIGIPDGIAEGERLLEAGAAGFRLGPRGLHAHPGDLRVFEILDAATGVASITMPYDEIASPEFAAVVDAHPSVTFRLEHVAAFDYAARTDPLADFAPVIELARRPNTVIMWSGFFHYSAEAPPYRDAWAVLEASLDAFGADRIMFSGDVNRAGGTDDSYLADVDAVRGLPFVDEAAATSILDSTARRLFGFERVA